MSRKNIIRVLAAIVGVAGAAIGLGVGSVLIGIAGGIVIAIVIGTTV